MISITGKQRRRKFTQYKQEQPTKMASKALQIQHTKQSRSQNKRNPDGERQS
jgi:hypothetical protein